MIDLAKKSFPKSTEVDTGNQKRESCHDVLLATCAILMEMASIDGEFSDAEREDIISILKKDYQLSDEYAAELLEASNK